MNQPVHLAGRRRAAILADMQTGLQAPMPPQISIRAQRFTLIDAAGVEQATNFFDQQFGVFLDVVIIGTNPHKSKQYYDGPYDPNNPAAPVCFSDNGVGPSTQSSKPQHATCNGCPQAGWGAKVSLMTGKGVPACSDRKKLAVIVAGDPAQLVYLLNIPPNSLKNLALYATELGKQQITDAEGARRVDPADVVTRLYFDPTQQGTLLFQPVGYWEQMWPYVGALMEQADGSGVIDTIVGNHDVPIQGALPAPAAAPTVTHQPQPPVQQLQPPPQPVQAPAMTTPTSWGAPTPQPMPQGGFAPQPPQNQPAMQQQPPAQQQPAAPATRGRRGGARAGAGRPGGQAAPPPNPAGPAPFQAQQPVQTVMPPQQPTQPQGFQMRPAPTAPAGDPGPMPPFLQRQQPGNGAFGMAQGAPPNPELAAAIEGAFGTPLQPRARG